MHYFLLQTLSSTILFSNFQILSELHSFNLKLYSKQYNKVFVLHLIVAPQLSSGWRHNYSTKTRQAGRTDEQSMYSLLSMVSFSQCLRTNIFNFSLSFSFYNKSFLWLTERDCLKTFTLTKVIHILLLFKLSNDWHQNNTIHFNLSTMKKRLI